MATIKEMTEQYGKVNYIVRYTADGDKKIDEDTCAEAFKDGANAVLEMLYHTAYKEDWRKSLKDRFTWKPSEEQMNALDDVISSRDTKYDVLSELWKDLKKLI